MPDTLNILLIDDQPYTDHYGHTVKARIEEALRGLVEFKLHVIEDNDPKKLEEQFNTVQPDIVILDWNFPQDKPSGEKTLNYLRKNLKFERPILIHTQTYDTFEKYLGPEGANAYYWWGSGVTGLRQVMERLVFLVKSCSESHDTAIESGEADLASMFTYYKDINTILKRHCYHPHANKPHLSKTKQKEAIETVGLITSAYENNDQDNGKIDPDHSMGKVLSYVESFASHDVATVIIGDSGTGKELVARLLHFHHTRLAKYNDIAACPSRHYIAVNCGAFPENLLNSELFGCLPGAYTDATEKAGLFEQVSYNQNNKLIKGATVFLDEIALLSPQSQAFLLRVLQEKTVLRMGYDLTKFSTGRKTVKTVASNIPASKFGPIPVNFRLITATNEDLRKKALDKKFRLDLYYRIAENGIYLPSLRDRGTEDFNLLFQYFLYKFNKNNGTGIKLDNKDGNLCGNSLDLLLYLWTNFPWTGNVRELESVVRATAINKQVRDGDDGLSIKDIPEFWRSTYL